ncbi:transposase [Methanococcoides sp.]|uniref:transposase n=1 Tax=Methanococcoides sp. TaxID=1966350 RepID=UPI00272DD6DD|nr:transposase [Methanococcoides sp.]
MAAIGYLRWFFNYQREEIQLLLGARGIQISTGEISRLSEEFLLRFYILHKKHSSQMKELFETNKGFILHLDGSAEAGDEITFTAKEGMTEITIDSWIMPSESRHYIKPFLQHIKDTYGTPLVVIRDMSKEISKAASEVFPGVLHQICHSHFIRNLGDILFKHRYKALRNKMINTKVLHKFLSLKKKCFEGTTSKNKIVAAEHYWVMLAIEYILYPRERRSDYPFVLPYLEVMNRVMEITSMTRKIVMWNARHNFGVSVVLKFDAYLKKLVDDKDVKLYFTKIGHIWGWFEEIRSVLRVSREFSGKEQNNLPTNADKLKGKTIEAMMKIKGEGRKIGGDLRMVSEKIYENCQSHMDELFVKVMNNEGEILDVVRHNALEELNHRWSRMHIRRRTGRSKTTKEMTKYGALLAVLSNLENEEYVKTVLGDVDDFVRELQNVTDEELQEARRLIRKFPQCPLIKSDVKRPEILWEFVAIVEDEFNDVSDENVNTWLSNFICTEVRLTP